MKISILVLLVGTSFSLLGQTDSSALSEKRIRYFNNFLSGGLVGEEGQGTGFTFSTTHGIRFKRLAFGLGVGYDAYYDWRVVPFYGSINFDFAKIKQNAFYLQINGGYSHAERTRKEEWLTEYREYGGEVISTMVGYRVATNKLNIYVAAGHKFQKTNFSYNPAPWSSWVPQAVLAVEESMNRVVLQVGFGWH